eukprot:COSAG01_NODE_6_length_54687_cov_500.907599_26_plen_428_part_00
MSDAKNPLIQRYEKVISPVIGHFTDKVFCKGQGCYLIDEHDKAYLDFTCGIAVTSVGHCHPKVVAALKEQADRLWHCSIGMGYYDAPIKLSESLNSKLKGDYQAYFCQSGAEAVEAAIKCALYTTQRPKLISHIGGFHGRTIGALSVTSKQKYRDRYNALLGDQVSFIPYPDPYREDWAQPNTTEAQFKEHLVAQNCFHDDVAAVIVECIQGEGGYIPAPKAYLLALAELCQEKGILLICDEIQSGIGRTGHWFSFQHPDLNLRPDIITMAKGLGSGVPIGACLAKTEHMQKWDTSRHGSTYGGNALVCEVARTTLEVIDERLPQVANLGKIALAYLKKALAQHPHVGEIRGEGLMIGVELVKDKKSKAAHPDLVTQVRKACLEQGLLIIFCGEEGQVLRLIPPLIIDEETLMKGLTILTKVLNDHH